MWRAIGFLYANKPRGLTEGQLALSADFPVSCSTRWHCSDDTLSIQAQLACSHLGLYSFSMVSMADRAA